VVSIGPPFLENPELRSISMALEGVAVAGEILDEESSIFVTVI